MSTLRRHPLTGEPVIVAPHRGLRPYAFDVRRSRHRTPTETCPFCPGNEDETPPEILRKGTGGRWELRVVPNRYPAVDLAGGGVHEVVVEAADHDARFEELPADHASMILTTYLERYRTLAANPALRFITIFKNDGDDSGQSIDHLHSQILGLPMVPPRAALLARGFETGPCALCEMLADGNLAVWRGERFVLLVPPVSLFPYEQWIVPAVHSPNFTTLETADIAELARLMQNAVGTVGRLLERPSFNWIFQNSPIPAQQSFHWFLQLFPRVALQGGFELGSGMQINIVDANRAAAELRERLKP